MAAERKARMTDEQIKYMVNRFLQWRLPENFNPDGGISFKGTFNEHTSHPMKHEPVGTNLFDFTQAEGMIRYMMEGMPPAESETQLREALQPFADLASVEVLDHMDESHYGSGEFHIEAADIRRAKSVLAPKKGTGTVSRP
jgi:hypothetical protein